MDSFIVFLRGVNVGGHRKLPMADLRAALEARSDVARAESYIASGNLRLEVEGDAAALVEAAIAERFGLEVEALAVDATAYRALMQANPFPEGEGSKVHAWLWQTQPDPDHARIDALKSASEEIAFTDRAVWLHAPDGIGRSKLAAGMEAALGVSATARNLNTLRKMAEMLDG